jgi:hypothetical protein
MVVVHPDTEFLEDITGKLKEVCVFVSLKSINHVYINLPP